MRKLGTGARCVSVDNTEREYCIALVRLGYLKNLTGGMFEILKLPETDMNVSDALTEVYPNSKKYYKTGSQRKYTGNSSFEGDGSDFVALDVAMEGIRKEWAPKFSSQLRYERNCGLHCISMITHLPISIIHEQIGKNGATTGRQVWSALWMLGWDSSHAIVKCRDWKELPKLCILDLRKPKKRDGHWAVWYEDSIWDSCCGVYDNIEFYCLDTGLKLYGYIEVKLVK